MSTAPQTILILGGGVGGITTAVLLRERLGDAHRIVLVEREATYVFAPSLLWLLTGDREPAAISRPLDRLAGRGVEVVRGPMGVTGADNSAAVRQMVEQHGVTYHPEHVTVRAERSGAHFSNGTSAAFDLLGYVPPHRPPRAVAASGRGTSTPNPARRSR